VLKVPTGDPEQYALIEKLPPAQTITANGKHKVEQGDTLYGLAGKYGVRLADLQEVNGLSSKSILRIGMLLEIPESVKKSASAAKK
jgi:membrane-bound lytic murein transglycosylase D